MTSALVPGLSIITSFFFASIHISHERFQTPVPPGAVNGEYGFGA